MENRKLQEIVSLFDVQGTVTNIAPLGAGLINDTYRIETAEKDQPNYVMQRVNNNVFPDVDMVMRNILAVTTHIRQKLESRGEQDIDRKVLTFIPLKNDKEKYYALVNGEYWRVMIFIENAVTKQAVNPESSYAAGLAFGEFESMLADIPVELGETIKDFHNMEFDQQDNVLCVVDLDTVMPNFVFSDYGDFLRTAANFVAEDCPDMEKVGFNMDIYKAFTEGYLKSAAKFLLPIEVENLPYAAALFPYMQCVRFLWDYLSGDKYWKCQYPTHNFVRADNQLHLLFSIESHYPEMKAFIQQCMKK